MHSTNAEYLIRTSTAEYGIHNLEWKNKENIRKPRIFGVNLNKSKHWKVWKGTQTTTLFCCNASLQTFFLCSFHIWGHYFENCCFVIKGFQGKHTPHIVWSGIFGSKTFAKKFKKFTDWLWTSLQFVNACVLILWSHFTVLPSSLCHLFQRQSMEVEMLKMIMQLYSLHRFLYIRCNCSSSTNTWKKQKWMCHTFMR